MTKQLRPQTIEELKARARFSDLEQIVQKAFSEMRPADRLSVTEAAEQYTKLGSGGGYSKPWSLSKTPYLKEPQDVLSSLDFQGMVFVGPARTGKALSVETDMPTPLGWRKMGDLVEGDEVFGSDGRPTRITFATGVMHNRPCYRVEFADGSSLIADEEHLWTVRDIKVETNGRVCCSDKHKANAEKYTRTLTTGEIISEGVTFGNGRQRSRFAIATPSPVHYEEKDLFIDPYIMGAWLGDGSMINFTLSVGKEDLDATVENIISRGWRCRVYKPSQIRKCYTLAIQGPDGVFLDQYFSTLGFDENTKKHIPEEYMVASEHQRRELLKGLMDTDGTIYGEHGRHVQFVSVDAGLAAQVKELVASLGYKVSSRVKPSFIGRKQHKDAHLVEFTVYDGSEVFALPRKAERSVTNAKRRESQTGSRFITNIVPVESVPVKCIQVDAEDHLYLAGRDYIVTHNTMMGLNAISHTVKTDPRDMLYVHMDRENARKWSSGDLGRYLQSSTAIRAEQLTSRQFDNTFDKTFKSGMRFLLTYPTASNLSGITVPFVGFIDYDRMDDDVDGEGNPFDLGSMRTTTFKRFAMTFAESSPNPNKEIQDPRWIPETPHQAPPIRGIFELYNRGDRRRWMWCCPSCAEWFEPDFKLLEWGNKTDPMEAREATVLVCPHNGCVLRPHQKDTMNNTGRWIREGEMIESGMDGAIVERPGMKATRSSIASFWLKGPAAAYQDWGQLVEKYLRAVKALAETGDDGPLRKTVTTDQGNFYIPHSRMSEMSPEVLKNKAEDWGSTPENPTVPEGVRFLIGTVDVQKSSFVCQVNGFTATGDMVVVDAFKIRLSNRLNANGERLPLEPGAFKDDWDTLETELLNKTYELADGSGRRMRLRAAASDSGGQEGVTGHAYEFWRRLKAKGEGAHRRFILVKGSPTPSAPRARTTWPDASQKDKYATARGDVPVVMLNSNSLKDMVYLLLQRTAADDDGAAEGGKMRYPDWLENWFYMQLTSEIRTPKGWDNTRKKRNESFDLSYYAQAIALRPMESGVPYIHFGVDRIDFNAPPIWAAEWDENEFVFMPGSEDAPKKRKRKSLSELAKDLA